MRKILHGKPKYLLSFDGKAVHECSGQDTQIRSDYPQGIDEFVKPRLWDEKQCRPALKIDAKTWRVPVSNRGEREDLTETSRKRDSKGRKHVKEQTRWMMDGTTWKEIIRDENYQLIVYTEM